MSRYEGLDERLKLTVCKRDNWRCRWCGATNRGGDCHHIRYRRGEVDDVAENLILLCRGCHTFVHDSYRIPKRVAQQILFSLVETPGVTGLSVWQKIKASNKAKVPVDSALARRMAKETNVDAQGQGVPAGVQQPPQAGREPQEQAQP